MNTTVTRLLIGIALTAGITYLLDPTSGRRRRAALRDQAEKAAHKLNDGTRTARADLAGGAQRLAGQCTSQAKSLAGHAKSLAGSVADQARSFVKPDPARDDVVASRVRAALRRNLSDSSSIGVAADQGRLILHGSVSPQEHETLRECLREVAGSREVTDHLIERDSGNGHVTSRRLRRFDLSREEWDPAPRFLVGALGAALLALGLKQRGLLSLLAPAVALPMIARSAINKPLKRVGRNHGVVDIHKTIVVDAPVERVFALLEKPEQFPSFMRRVREVRRENGHLHWVVAGPVGTAIEWDATTTVNRPNEMLAWHSEPDSTIEHAGVIRFERLAPDQTRLDVILSYSPPAGTLGHYAAKLFGADAGSELDEELARTKRFAETFKSSADAEARSREAEPSSARSRRRHAATDGDTGSLHTS
jgi:uncharacterized membrane protein/osmotically-inducible protein OsmY